MGPDLEYLCETAVLAQTGFSLFSIPHLHKSCIFLTTTLQFPSRDLLHVGTGGEFATAKL